MSDEKLIRGIGRWDLTALVINCIIGAGIFGLPSKAYALVGSYSIFVCAVCAFIILFIVFCYAEVASQFSKTGGPYLYAREAFGPLIGFETAWLYFIVRVSTFAANCNLLVSYLAVFWSGATQPTPRLLIIGFVVLALTGVNLVGVRQSTAATNFFTIGKLLPLFIFAGVGIFFLDRTNFSFEPAPGYAASSSAILLLIYAFLGFENAVIPTGEVKEPKRNVPFALLSGLAVVTLIYVTIQVVSIGTLSTLASSDRPLADAAATFMGPVGAGFIALGAAISILGNLNVSVLGTSRILYATGQEGDMPKFLAMTHPRFHTPYVSLLIGAVVTLVLTIWTSFLSALALATITRLIVYLTTCASLPVFRYRRSDTQAAFKAPYGLFVCVVSLTLIVWLLTQVDFAREGLPVIVAALIGLVLYVFARTRMR